MRRADGRRNDLAASTGHEVLAARDYERLRSVGITTVREGTSWHRMEPAAGVFDPASALIRIRASRAMGIQAIWDLCHFGWPDDTDPFDEDFPDRLAGFAARFAAVLRDETDDVPWYTPVNEPSFVAWAAGDVAYLNPFQRGRGNELKRQIVRAELAAAAAVRDIDPRARICHIDPIIHIVPNAADASLGAIAARHNESQFEAWDMLGGRRDHDLGGAEAELDVIGVNFYDRNQWVDGGPTLAIGDPGYRALRDLLGDVHRRYRRPIVVAETGTEGDGRVTWLQYVCDEVAAARDAGIPVEGICIYPIIEHPGWDDDRRVPVGLWGYPDEMGARPPYQPLIDEVLAQTPRFQPAIAAPAAQDAAGRRSGSSDPSGQRRLVICLVTESREPSGMGRLMLTLGRGLAQRGHRLIVAAPDAVGARWVLAEAQSMGLETWALVDASPQSQAAALADRLASQHVDVVNVHAGIGWEGHAAAARARRCDVGAVVRTEHLPYLLTKSRDKEEYRSGLANLDSIIAVSNGVAASHVAAGVAVDMVRIVRNGIDEPSAADGTAEKPGATARAAVGVGVGVPLVVSVGRLTDQKGYDVLLAAAPTVLLERPETQLLLVGSGPLEASIRESIRALDLDGNVRLLSHWDRVPDLLAGADLVVLPSRFEGLPLVALEAMAMGRPIVGTHVCGLDEAVEDGVTGRLVAAENSVTLAHAILELLGDPAGAAAFGAAGRRRFADAFTAERMVAGIEIAYRDILRRTKVADPAYLASTEASMPSHVTQNP